MKKLLTILLSVLMVVTLGCVNVFAGENEEDAVGAGEQDNPVVFSVAVDSTSTVGSDTIPTIKLDNVDVSADNAKMAVKGEKHTLTWSISANPSDGATLTTTGSWTVVAEKQARTSNTVKFLKAGTYTVTANVANGKGDTHTITWTYSIDNRTELTIPSVSGTLTYTGTEQTPTFANYDSSIMDLAITAKKDVANNYTATFSIKDKTNYKWADGSDTDKEVTWGIEPVNLSEVSIENIKASSDGFNCVFDVKLGSVSLTKDVDYEVKDNSDMPTIFGDNTLTIVAKGNNFVANSTKTATYNTGRILDIKKDYEGDKDYTTPSLKPVYKDNDSTKDILRFHALTTEDYLVTVLEWKSKDGWHVVGLKKEAPNAGMEEAAGAEENDAHIIDLLTTLGSKKYSFALGDINNCPHKNKTIHGENFVVGTTVYEATLTVEKKPTPTPTPKKKVTYVAPKTGVE